MEFAQWYTLHILWHFIKDWHQLIRYPKAKLVKGEMVSHLRHQLHDCAPCFLSEPVKKFTAARCSVCSAIIVVVVVSLRSRCRGSDTRNSAPPTVCGNGGREASWSTGTTGRSVGLADVRTDGRAGGQGRKLIVFHIPWVRSVVSQSDWLSLCLSFQLSLVPCCGTHAGSTRTCTIPPLSQTFHSLIQHELLVRRLCVFCSWYCFTRFR